MKSKLGVKKMKKKVLLAMPYNYSLHSMIKNELEYMGHDVTLITNRYNLSIFEKAYILFDQIINKKSREESHNKILKRRINKYEHYDICLVILVNGFRIDLLHLMKEKSDLMISYHLDGMDRFDNVESKIKYFDKFYVFDKNDLYKYPQYNLILSHNFYFENSGKQQFNDKDKIDFYYLAMYDESRVDILNELSDYFNENNISYNFDIFAPKDAFRFENRNANRIYKHIPYKKFTELMSKSRYILDVVIEAHSGLSLRIIESMLYKKKVVTSNKTVKDYDFYDSQNIFILGERDISELKDFFKSGYKEIAPEIVAKYSFENWFNEIIK